MRTNTIVLENGKSGRVPYLSKTKSGISVTNHSALRYEAVRNPGRMNTYQMHAMLSLNDSNVLQEYHSILIPKAVEYSAGILDYFFRATIDVTGSFDEETDLYTFHVVNTSSQDFGRGQFFLIAEDTNNVRTIVQTNIVTTVPTNINQDITYPGPAPQRDQVHGGLSRYGGRGRERERFGSGGYEYLHRRRLAVQTGHHLQ